METRRILFRIGLSIIPEYFWIGQGFGRVEDLYANFYDPNFATAHVNQGVFYNGFIGLMVNTGVFGTLFFLIFAIGGSLIAFRLIRLIRYQPCNTYFLRLCSVLSGLWIANLIAFFFFHGDSEFAIKSFALQSGLLIACEQHWWNLYGNSNSSSVAES